MGFLVGGTSVGGAAVAVTIPSASNIVAVMTWFYEDGGSGATPTVPGGATATSIGTPAFDRAGASYRVTGLSDGSATFTPPSTGGNQACLVAVFGDADGTGATLYDTVWEVTPVSQSVSTPGTGDFVLLVGAVPGGPTTLSGSSGSTLIANSAASLYGGIMGAVYLARSGATTAIEAAYTGVWPPNWTVVISEAAAAGNTPHGPFGLPLHGPFGGPL